MRLDKLLERLEYEVVQGSAQTEVTTLVNDSRKVEKGSVFVCISGAVSDGHRFAPDVAEKGAAALVVEKEVDVPADVTVIRVPDTRYALALMSAAYFGYPAEKLKIIGITGTKGKTTTTYMIRSILEGVGHKVGLIGTIEAIIGDRKIPAANTTPESFTIHQYFAEMVKEGCDSVVMEVSSQGLMLHRTAGIPFEIGIFTNLGHDHIGPNEHKDFDDYKRCKGLLFKQCRLGIANVDDKYFEDVFRILGESGPPGGGCPAGVQTGLPGRCLPCGGADGLRCGDRHPGYIQRLQFTDRYRRVPPFPGAGG